MANIKSAKKRIRVTEKKTLVNKMVKSALKTSIKRFEEAVVAGNKEVAAEKLNETIKALDMAATKNILHKNKAARRKSRLSARLNAMARSEEHTSELQSR